jgi:anti-sigma regulatory factor (Ser/Thr protein kinase)
MLGKHDYEFAYVAGNNWPYDAPDGSDDGSEPVAHTNQWEYRAARGVMHEITGRSGFDFDIDEDTRIEIVEALANIILFAKHQASNEV